MLHSYVPALVFLFLGTTVGLLFTYLNGVLGPKRPNKVKSEPYESGLPSEVKATFRFGISFYLIAMLFILFDIEVVFLFPIAVQLRPSGRSPSGRPSCSWCCCSWASCSCGEGGRWNGSEPRERCGATRRTCACASCARGRCSAVSWRARTSSATSRSA